MAGSVSLVAGLLLAERLVRPEVIDQVATPALLGLVLLFVLPALTFFAIRHDARVLARVRGAPGDFAEATHEDLAPGARAVRHLGSERDPATHRHAPRHRSIPTD